MEKIIAVQHRAEITVTYDLQNNEVSIISDECPTVADPDLGTGQELKISPADIPRPDRCLAKSPFRDDSRLLNPITLRLKP